jgi:formylglycine-generating enzyme required for sulfatase activity
MSFFGQTVNVGGYAANPWGLFDTHGHVWEWCIDWWNGSANYPTSAVTDPYVATGLDRIVRGGAWNYTADSCRSANRNISYPGPNIDVGFRVVLAPILVP